MSKKDGFPRSIKVLSLLLPNAFLAWFPNVALILCFLHGFLKIRDRCRKNCDLHRDRLSDHRFMANYFRLLMHALAYNLLVRQRQWIADPPAPAPEVSADSTPQLVPASEALPNLNLFQKVAQAKATLATT